jgi:hypothetical protein
LVVIRVVLLWVFLLTGAVFLLINGPPKLISLLNIFEPKDGKNASSQTDSLQVAGSSPLGQSLVSGSASPGPKPKAERLESVETNATATHPKAVSPEIVWYNILAVISQWSRDVSSWTGPILVVLFLLERVAKVTDPIMLEAKKRTMVPDFEGKLDFIEQLHKDFKRVVASYVGNSARIFVFIDDLDRCDVPKAADLMQGLNLLITDSPQIVFIIGIDRAKVAAALAVKYEKLLPYFSTFGKEAKKLLGEFDPTPGLEFGYSFLEKFIQVAFCVPRMSAEEMPNFLQSLEKSERAIEASQQSHDQTYVPPQIAEDTSEIYEIADAVSKTMDFNPRKLKQFLNVFRLHRFIAYHTGRLKGFSSDSPKAVSVQQLAVFVATILRWPGIIPELRKHSGLIQWLYCLSNGINTDLTNDERTAQTRWGMKSGVEELFKLGSRDGYIRPEWDLREFEAKWILNVSPNIIPIARVSKPMEWKRDTISVVNE